MRKGCRVLCLLQSRLYQIIICSALTLSFPSSCARCAPTNLLASWSDESHADSLEISRFHRGRDGIAQGHLPRLYFVGPSTIHSLTALYRFFYHLSLNGIRHSLFFCKLFVCQRSILGSLREVGDFWLWAVLRCLGNYGCFKKFIRYIIVFLSFFVKGSSDRHGESLRPNG